MGKKAKGYLARAVKSYEKDDGATARGAMRDAFTDLMHIAFGKRKAIGFTTEDDGHLPQWSLCVIKDFVDDAYDVFIEELESKEHDRVMKIPRKKLPLHIHDTHTFGSAKKLFNDRLKGEKRV